MCEVLRSQVKYVNKRLNMKLDQWVHLLPKSTHMNVAE